MREREVLMGEKEGLLRFMFKDVARVDINIWNEAAKALDGCVEFTDETEKGRMIYLYPDALEA